MVSTGVALIFIRWPSLVQPPFLRLPLRQAECSVCSVYEAVTKNKGYSNTHMPGILFVARVNLKICRACSTEL